ncbi:MAG: fatty acid desaturase [Hyphomicrobiaceae bacterium]
MGTPATADTAAPATATGSRFSRTEISALRELDNTTNIRFIVGTWAVIAVTVAVAVWCYTAFNAGEIAFWWTIPVTIAAALIIGAAQHQLGGIIHEGTHFLLFKDRKLNEMISDWTAGFALYTSTHSFRLHHFAHHQFVNDPQRDPNFEQAQESGYWLDFPVEHVELVKGLIRMMSPISLIRYMVARAKQSAIGTETNPFSKPDAMGDPWAVRAGILFAVVAPLVAVVLVALGLFAAAFAFLLAAWIAVGVYYYVIPDEHYPQSRINPVVSLRITSICRMSFLAIVYLGLTVTEWATGAPVWGYYGLLWILPLFTAFPVYMILREWVQHGNADRGRYTNSRVFLVDPVSRYAVFPLGMDYHLPHHLFVGVPHYKLKRLHELLLGNPEYAEKCRVVDGWTGDSGRHGPSIAAVLGPEYAVDSKEVHINEETIAAADVNDHKGVAEQVAASRKMSGDD